MDANELKSVLSLALQDAMDRRNLLEVNCRMGGQQDDACRMRAAVERYTEALRLIDDAAHDGCSPCYRAAGDGPQAV